MLIPEMMRAVRVLGAATMAATAIAGCSADASSEEGESGTTSSALWDGYTAEGCNTTETLKLHDAIGVLLREGSTNFAAFRACLAGAALVENHCTTGAKIAEHLRSDDVTRIRCYDAPGNLNAEAPVSIDGEKLSIDHDFVKNNDARRVASVIGHELMHNRGFRHIANPHGSAKYPNTVPEQVEACIRNGAPNAWGGSGSAPSQTAGCTPPTPRPTPPPPPPGRVCSATQRCCEPLAGGRCGLCMGRNQECP